MSTILNKNALGQKYLKAERLKFINLSFFWDFLEDILKELNFKKIASYENEKFFHLENLIVKIIRYDEKIEITVDGFVLTFREEYDSAEKINHMIDLIRGYWKK